MSREARSLGEYVERLKYIRRMETQELDDESGTVIGVREGWLELKPFPRVPITASAIIVPTRTRPNRPRTRFTRRHHCAFCHRFS